MWTRPTIELMLVQYGQHENLYNVRHPDYKDRVKRCKSLYAILEQLKEVDTSLTIEGIKSKIHGLRSQYLKELSMVKASKRSGVGRDNVYVPKLWCFSLLEFLCPFVTSRPSSSSLSDSNKENESSGMNVDEEEDSLLNDSLPGTSQSSSLVTSSPSPLTSGPCSSSNKRKLAFSEQMEGVKRLVTKRLTETNEYEWITKQVDFEFRRITDEEIKSEMAYQIQTILREGRMKAELSRGTTEVPARDMQQNSNNSFCSDPPTITSTLAMISPVFRPIPAEAAIQPLSNILEQSLKGIAFDDDDF